MEGSDVSKSDSEDDEYIPEGEVTSSEASEGEDERDGKDPGLRKEDPEGRDGGVVDNEKSVPEPEEEKKRIEDLWGSFKQETRGPIPSSSSSKARSSSEEGTVAIKKTYDFAGEEVVVEEEVATSSKDAKKFLIGEQSDSKPVTPSAAVKPVTTAGAKRKGGVGSVLAMINKKPKMSTLEKSRLDWMKYRQQEGIEDQLEQNKKDGYLERQDFLKRSEMKQYELERELRMKRFGK